MGASLFVERWGQGTRDKGLEQIEISWLKHSEHQAIFV